MKHLNIGRLLLASAFLAAPAAALDFDALPSVREIAAQAAGTEVSVPLPAAPKDARVLKEWTIMVFMNGKNNLSDYVISDMNEMEKYGPTENINIITQAARIKYTPPSYPPGGGGYYDDFPGAIVPHPGWPNPYWGGLPPMLSKITTVKDASTDWAGVRRYLVTADGDNGSLSSTMLADLGTVDMGDFKQLAEFGKWVKQNYPAKKYMLVVWNHGSGWEMKGLDLFPAIKGISYDDETGHGIDTVQLAQAVREMGGVDIYASDACLMQMAEVVYELRDAAKVVVGSEENEPGDGWGYHEFLARVHSNKNNLTPEVMAAAAVQGYKAFYAGAGSKATTQSAVRTSGMLGFRTILDRWVDLAMKEDKALVTAARGEAVSFGGAGSKDLTHFMELVHGKTKSRTLKTQTVKVMDYFYNNVLIDNATTGDKFKKAYGMGAYLPGYSFDEDYAKLAWARDGKWDEFMKWLTEKQP
ncbi:MAG: clostripain-related cysteine peptidase [Elusimicrobiales bacterium]|nr:clostripain-related cysteine peptidase [Elusimicrobiales bacterium]